jgi:hypothetical protein
MERSGIRDSPQQRHQSFGIELIVLTPAMGLVKPVLDPMNPMPGLR